MHQASDLLSVVLIRAGRAARCGSLRCPDIVAVSTRFVRWIDRFEWDHPRPARGRRGEGGRAQHTHTATRTRGRSSDWCQRISPQRPKAQTVIPSVAILTGASARAATHTHATRARGAKARPRKVKRFALFRRQRGSDTGEYRLRPYGARGRAVAAGAAAARCKRAPATRHRWIASCAPPLDGRCAVPT